MACDISTYDNNMIENIVAACFLVPLCAVFIICTVVYNVLNDKPFLLLRLSHTDCLLILIDEKVFRTMPVIDFWRYTFIKVCVH